jgi:hypothetical protein
MRIFKNKWFGRWARSEGISDSDLVKASGEIAAGQVGVPLGGCLFKKRLARKGRGKRSGYRIIIGYKSAYPQRIIFLYAFAKNVKANISPKEKEALTLVTEAFIAATDEEVRRLLEAGSLVEVPHE